MRDMLNRSLKEAYEPLTERGVNLTDISTTVTDGRKAHRVEVRRNTIEARAKGDNGIIIEGYAATWDTFYPVAGGPPYGWVETIARGAVDKSIAEKDDVRLLTNHEGLALARVKDGDLELRSDDIGLWFRATLDGNRTDARDLAAAIESGNVDQCSWAFVVLRQEWNTDYTERTITEAKMFDVSVVTYPANPATIVGVVPDGTTAAIRTSTATIETRELEDGWTPRMAAMYANDENLVETFGQFDQSSGPDGAHYVPASPFPGLVCSSCIYFEGGNRCELVAGDINPGGICKRWVIPPALITVNERKGFPLSLAKAQADALL